MRLPTAVRSLKTKIGSVTHWCDNWDFRTFVTDNFIGVLWHCYRFFLSLRIMCNFKFNTQVHCSSNRLMHEKRNIFQEIYVSKNPIIFLLFLKVKTVHQIQQSISKIRIRRLHDFFNVFYLTHHVSLIHLNLFLDNLFWLDPDPWYAANVWVWIWLFSTQIWLILQLG